MSEKTMTPASDLATRFPEAVKADERKGVEGYLVEAKDLLKVAQTLRDEMGYDYLSSVTGVDYPEDNKQEVVYHFFKSTGGTYLPLSVQ
ncbi:MAG: NADH-quinone oxidoreductase subunit C, partial [Anaerolineales bacterium]